MRLCVQHLAELLPLAPRLLQLFRQLVESDGAEPGSRAAARFTLDRDAEPNLLTRDIGPYLVDRYSERKESAEGLSKRVNQRGI